MKRRITLLLALGLLVCAAAGIAYASSLQTVTRWWMGAGGGRATGGNVVLSSVVGQPVAGSASGGSVSICSGFWCGGQILVSSPPVFLPALTSKLAFYAPACSPANNRCEENDAPDTAYGPLGPGVDYQAYPDDQNDYYYFQPTATFSLNVQVTGYPLEGQLIIYNSSLTSIGSTFHNAGGSGTMSLALSNLPAGKYYVRIYTAPPYSSSGLYTLRVSW